MKILNRIFLYGALSTFCFFTSCSNDDCAQETFYQDADGDGYGDAAKSQTACTAPKGYVADNTDTDDTNANVFPGCTQVTYYKDSDGDGFGNPSISETVCEGEDTPSGYVADKTDPDDTNAAIFPDCEQVTVYEDTDGDGFGNPDVSQNLCSGEDTPEGFVVDNTDCDDTNAELNPDVVVTYYEDADGDGFGNPGVSQEVSVCADAPAGYVPLENTDCDDTDAEINPDVVVTYYEDADGDGFGNPQISKIATGCPIPQGFVLDNTDCDDADASKNPGAQDSSLDGVDTNCDGIPGTLWAGPNETFDKEGGADWTQPENQDRLTDRVVFTRQNAGPMYNYQWWQDNFDGDAIHNSKTESDLFADFWNADNAIKDFNEINPSGGTKGVRWALLDDTGADNPGDAWDQFSLYGTLGDPTHFYSFHNLCTIVRYLNINEQIIGVNNDFFVIKSDNVSVNATVQSQLVNKKLGVWLVEEDIYLTLTFTEWGNGQDNPGGAISYTRSTPNN
ncbi:putative metal-binding motif-containing protein [Flagellimonas allohymeniacidonis]|uniref:Metal-binding motif-containing protein n=1 Tax=Flagellimonas allohymeniacidonis TaxID=2517819 RepID=A0A4Q8QGS6_9FLAO|nr:putative metal-binding motif-containing protein [Allomuricauda hymeniacidonis]TAI48947.1 hypothetical protein EW142_03895 [Allomuricauda hymeniacidonis]